MEQGWLSPGKALSKAAHFEFGHGEKLVAGLFYRVFHPQPVEQRALGLLLAECGFVQAAEGMGPKSRPGRSHL